MEKKCLNLLQNESKIGLVLIGVAFVNVYSNGQKFSFYSRGHKTCLFKEANTKKLGLFIGKSTVMCM